MLESNLPDGSLAKDADQAGHIVAAAPATRLPGRRRLGLVVGVLAVFTLLVGIAAFLPFWLSPPKVQKPQTTRKETLREVPLDGEFSVFVRPPERAVQSQSVDEPGALPVRTGGIMSLHVQFNEPAVLYLVWIDCEGHVLPLYPWNSDTLEVTDINAPPPKRRPAKVLYSPLLGGGWKFGERGGLQTVLLLARRTPLDENTNLGKLIEPLPPSSMKHREEVVVLRLAGGEDSVSTLLAKNRGDESEALAADEPLRALMVRLGEHFELVRAVRFAHEGE